MSIYFKNDYTKNYPRQQITTTVRRDLYKQFQTLSVKIEEPTSKMLDILLLELFNNSLLFGEFENKVKLYR